jgi:hypothetical protein
LEERAGERRPIILLDAAARGDIPAGCRTNISGGLPEHDHLLSLSLSSKGGEGNGAAAEPKRRRRGALPAQSKTWRLWLALCFFILPSAFCLRAWGQTYSIDWQTIDGGGGTSTGGVYSVTCTIGQPDAGAMSGGNYTLQGGFWGIVAAIQTPGAPLLTIFHTITNTVTVSWPSPSTGWTLQQNTNSVSSLNWSNVTAIIQDDSTTKTLIVNPPAGNRFYRLHKP